MLGSHSCCLAVPESQFKIDALRPAGKPQDAAGVQAAFESITDNWRFRAWDIDLAVTRPQVASYADLFEWLVTCYGNSIRRTDFDLWIDHTPENMQYLQTLFDLFPTAKAVHIVRDGRAVAASVLPLDWGPNTFIGAANYWIEHVSYGLAAESHFGAARVFRVTYEDLVSQPEPVLQRLCAWLGIDYEGRMLDAEGFSKPKYYSSKAHRLIGARPDSTRADAWQTQLTAHQIGTFEAVSGDFLRYLGYELRYGLEAVRISSHQLIRSMITEAYMEIINRLRGRLRIRETVHKRV
jgi:hypothetical protein